MRLFIAFGLDEYKDYFNELQGQIDKTNAKLSFMNSYHLTLKFLGEIEEDNVRLLIEKLDSIKFNKLFFNLSEIGFFKNKFGINVIWQRIEPENETIKLKEEIDKSLKPYFNDDFRFHPHITLARVRIVKDKEKLMENIQNIKPKPKEIKIDSFHLIQSNITKEGVFYKVIRSFPITK